MTWRDVRTSEARVIRCGDVRLACPRHRGRSHCGVEAVDRWGIRGWVFLSALCFFFFFFSIFFFPAKPLAS